ncbi:hypothetical protein FB451DRAFT_672056 [Mycena latifolia]|nr:hypothetical protein FB451DRAFT_672056 [Mycena latifolia]
MLGWEWTSGNPAKADITSSIQDFTDEHRADHSYIASSIQEFTEEQRTDHSYIMRSVKDLAQEHRIAHDQTISTLKDATEEQKTEHTYIAKSIRDVARNQEHYHDSEERQKILDWYSPLNFFLRQADIFSAWQPGTGGWLLEAGLFREWKSGSGKFLWCRGIPGAGKTVLASIVVENLRTEQNTGVAVLYLNHKETETPSNLLAALWRQLVFAKPIPRAVHHLYAKHHEQRTRPSLEDTHTILCSIISAHPSVFIIVDALDEYSEELRDTLIGHLSALGPTVNLMLTSRPHIKIDHIMVDSGLETMEIRATEDDIRRHITAQVAKSSRLSKHVKSCLGLREEIETTIIRRSDGMFLLAKFHIDSLTTKHTIKAVRDALTNMPEDLNDTYGDIMQRINQQSEDDKSLAHHTLSWISNVKRPLRPAELTEALAVELGANEGEYDSALQAASVNGHDDILHILLAHGADINLHGRRYGTAMQMAAFFDQRTSARLLIDRGANINAEGGRYGTALYAAAIQGNEEIVRLLLENGAAVHQQGGHYGTALCASIYRGSDAIARVLIEHGAELDEETVKCNWAIRSRMFPMLHRAISMGHEEVIRLFTRRTISCHLRYRFLLSLNRRLNCHLRESGPPSPFVEFRGFPRPRRSLVFWGHFVLKYDKELLTAFSICLER